MSFFGKWKIRKRVAAFLAAMAFSNVAAAKSGWTVATANSRAAAVEVYKQLEKQDDWSITQQRDFAEKLLTYGKNLASEIEGNVRQENYERASKNMKAFIAIAKVLKPLKTPNAQNGYAIVYAELRGFLLGTSERLAKTAASEFRTDIHKARQTYQKFLDLWVVMDNTGATHELEKNNAIIMASLQKQVEIKKKREILARPYRSIPQGRYVFKGEVINLVISKAGDLVTAEYKSDPGKMLHIIQTGGSLKDDWTRATAGKDKKVVEVAESFMKRQIPGLWILIK
jgi:hypothetical protein